MTQEQIDNLLQTSRSQRDYAKRMIDEQFDQLDKRNDLTRWFKLYLLHKASVEWLEKQKADPTGGPNE